VSFSFALETFLKLSFTAFLTTTISQNVYASKHKEGYFIPLVSLSIHVFYFLSFIFALLPAENDFCVIDNSLSINNALKRTNQHNKTKPKSKLVE
jgi:hypothetical protein